MKTGVITLILIALVAMGAYLLKAQGHMPEEQLPSPAPTHTATPSPLPPVITAFPKDIEQGEPILVGIEGVAAMADIQSLTFEGKQLGMFLYNGHPSAFVGIDLAKKPGAYALSATLADGTVLEKTIEVLPRKKITATLGIPEKLGGNTPAAASKLVTTMAAEGQTLLTVKSEPTTFWNGAFVFPVANPVVTDDYGYTRDTVGYAITHKGTDFRSPEGGDVMAINAGIVRVVKDYQIYGKTVIIDHGQGLLSMYMHLSKANVRVGDAVYTGQVIALSGHTGYAESPHLHLTIRINGISIDPMKFFALFPPNLE